MVSEALLVLKGVETQESMSRAHEEVTIVHLKFVLNVLESTIF